MRPLVYNASYPASGDVCNGAININSRPVIQHAADSKGTVCRPNIWVASLSGLSVEAYNDRCLKTTCYKPKFSVLTCRRLSDMPEEISTALVGQVLRNRLLKSRGITGQYMSWSYEGHRIPYILPGRYPIGKITSEQISLRTDQVLRVTRWCHVGTWFEPSAILSLYNKIGRSGLTRQAWIEKENQRVCCSHIHSLQSWRSNSFVLDSSESNKSKDPRQ